MKKTELSLSDTIKLMDAVIDGSCQSVDMGVYNGVVAIENGGVPFGKYVAKKLKMPFTTIKIQFYSDDDIPNDKPIHVDIDIDKLKSMTPFILVDDIVDTGRTIKYFQNVTEFSRVKDFWLMSLHWCIDHSVVAPCIYGAEKTKNEWIVYPWERNIPFDELWEAICKK
jgi:hypoxanthine phosphoribosyltransferase